MKSRTTKQSLVIRLTELIENGEQVLATRHTQPGYVEGLFVDQALFHQWKTSSIAFLKTKMGAEGTHLHSFIDSVEQAKYSDTVTGVSVLRSAKDDIEGDHLMKIEALVSAEIFDDFLEMAEHLLENGYFQPAASLVGAILEESLRRIAANNGVSTSRREDISSLNSKLADAGVYNRFKQRQIQSWKLVRDMADHGQYKQLKKSDVEAVFTGIRDFLAEYG